MKTLTFRRVPNPQQTKFKLQIFDGRNLFFYRIIHFYLIKTNRKTFKLEMYQIDEAEQHEHFSWLVIHVWNDRCAFANGI